METYTLGLFTNMYPAFEGDYRGIFIRQMVRDLESRGITVKKAIKTTSNVIGYGQFFYQSLHLARDRSIDLIQAEYIPHSSLIPSILGRKEIPQVLKFHGDDARIYPFKNRFNKMLTRFMLNRAAHIITASEEMRRTLIGIGADPAQITSIHTGVDTGFFSPRPREESRKILGLPHEQTIFLFVGRLHPWKGVYEILEVARRCRDFKFIFIGPGNIPVHPDNCFFVGTKISQEIRIWLNAADCLLLPTHTEAIPTSVMEAFACGIPAIATRVGGCPEIVENEKNGLLIPVGDIESLEESVIWMNTNPDEREKMGNAGRKFVIDHYDHSKLIEKLIDVHRILIE